MKALVLREERRSEWGEKAPPVVDARLLAILDLSGSMAQKDAGEGNQRRVDVLKDALGQLVESFPNQVVAIGFNSDAFSIQLNVALKPEGCTSLYKALVLADVQAKIIGNVVLVSDGQPTDGKNDDSLALVQGWSLAGVKFSVVYCGPEGGMGEQFLHRLTKAGGGSYTHCEVQVHLLVDALETALLAAPAGKVIQL